MAVANFSTLIKSVTQTYFDDRTETPILINFQKCIYNGNIQICVIKKKLLTAKENIDNFPDLVYATIKEEKVKLQSILAEFDKVYNCLIDTNLNAIKTKQECEKQLAELKDTHYGIEILLTAESENLVEKEEELEENEKDCIEAEKSVKWHNLHIKCFKAILFLFFLTIAGTVAYAIYLGIHMSWGLALIIFLIVFCCGGCLFTSAIMNYNADNSDAMNVRKRRNGLVQDVKDAKNNTQQLRNSLQQNTKLFNDLILKCKNQNSKILVFEEVIKILCNHQNVLRDWQNPLDKSITIYETYNCNHVPIQQLQKRDQKLFIEKMHNIFIEIEEISKRFESQTISLPLAFSDTNTFNFETIVNECVE